MQRILLTGGTGQIGTKLIRYLDDLFQEPLSIDLYLLEHTRKIDEQAIASLKYFNLVKVIHDLAEGNFSLTLHLAANIHTRYSNLPEYRQKFLSDNVTLTEKVCEVSDRVLFLSTDNVFSGDDNRNYKELDLPQPCNFYGETKALAEKIVLENKGTVIRIQTMLGVPRNLILDRVFNAIAGKEHPPFWYNTYSRPSYFKDLFSVLKQLNESDENGIFHVSCKGNPMSRAEIANKVLEIYKEQGFPVKIDKLESEACTIKFPRRLVLDTEETQSRLELSFTELDSALYQHVIKYGGRTADSG